jgi:hypothetical protein
MEADAMEIDTDGVAGQAAPELAVIKGAKWFGPELRPFVLRVEVPLTCEEVVAALYSNVEPDEFASGEDLCGCVAVALLTEGLPAVQAHAERLSASELSGELESPEFLALCRQRVSELLAT